MNKFIIVSKGLFGYFISLADNDGPIERLEDYNYNTAEEAAIYAEELAWAWHIKFLR